MTPPNGDGALGALLVLTTDQARTIIDGAVAAYPEESCGLLCGVQTAAVRIVTRVWPARNLADDPARRFDLDPAVRIAAEIECRRSGERIIGHWHSHPNGRPDPSPEDLAMVYEPDLVWLIVASDAQGPAQGHFQLNAFLPAADGTAFHPVGLRVEDRAGP